MEALQRTASGAPPLRQANSSAPPGLHSFGAYHLSFNLSITPRVVSAGVRAETSWLCGMHLPHPQADQAKGLFASFVTFLSNKEKLNRSPFSKGLFGKALSADKENFQKDFFPKSRLLFKKIFLFPISFSNTKNLYLSYSINTLDFSAAISIHI